MTPLEQLFVIFMFIALFTWWLYTEESFNDIIDYFKKSKSEEMMRKSKNLNQLIEKH